MQDTQFIGIPWVNICKWIKIFFLKARRFAKEAETANDKFANEKEDRKALEFTNSKLLAANKDLESTNEKLDSQFKSKVCVNKDWIFYEIF